MKLNDSVEVPQSPTKVSQQLQTHETKNHGVKKTATPVREDPGRNSFKVYGSTFRVHSKYEFLGPLGKGSYGLVCAARDTTSNEKVAIKKISPMAKNLSDAKHTLRELVLLRHLGNHPNIITMRDVIVDEQEDELYVVMDLMDTDLHRVIQSSQVLTESHQKYFLHQLLRGVKYLHDNQVLHRDLKPGNLLITKNCSLKIADFGLSRKIPLGSTPKASLHGGQCTLQPMTQHVVTRWYRPPELMLQPDGFYSKPLDIWSIGCIFAEMLGRKPFFPGKNFVHQLTLIFDVIGTPSPQEAAKIQSSQAQNFLKSLKKKKRVPLETYFPTASAEAISLLEQMLQFNPSDRCTIEQALYHPFVYDLEKRYHRKQPEFPIVDFEFGCDQEGQSRISIRDMIMDEAAKFNAEQHRIRQNSNKNQNQNNQNQEARDVHIHTDAFTSNAVPLRQRRRPASAHGLFTHTSQTRKESKFLQAMSQAFPDKAERGVNQSSAIQTNQKPDDQRVQRVPIQVDKEMQATTLLSQARTGGNAQKVNQAENDPCLFEPLQTQQRASSHASSAKIVEEKAIATVEVAAAVERREGGDVPEQSSRNSTSLAITFQTEEGDCILRGAIPQAISTTDTSSKSINQPQEKRGIAEGRKSFLNAFLRPRSAPFYSKPKPSVAAPLEELAPRESSSSPLLVQTECKTFAHPTLEKVEPFTQLEHEDVSLRGGKEEDVKTPCDVKKPLTTSQAKQTVANQENENKLLQDGSTIKSRNKGKDTSTFKLNATLDDQRELGRVSTPVRNIVSSIKSLLQKNTIRTSGLPTTSLQKSFDFTPETLRSDLKGDDGMEKEMMQKFPPGGVRRPRSAATLSHRKPNSNARGANMESSTVVTPHLQSTTSTKSQLKVSKNTKRSSVNLPTSNDGNTSTKTSVKNRPRTATTSTVAEKCMAEDSVLASHAKKDVASRSSANKKVTQPYSPKFSIMSWERKLHSKYSST